jgi:hypothetical protein
MTLVIPRPLAFVACFLLLVLTVLAVNKWQSQRAHDQAFRAEFGINIPTSELQRSLARPVVQKQLDRLERLANVSLFPPTDLSSLNATKAAINHWIAAQKMAASERLTREDEMDEVLEHVDQTLKRTEALIKTFPGQKETGAEVLKRFGEKKQ